MIVTNEDINMSNFSRTDIKRFFSEVKYEHLDEQSSSMLSEGQNKNQLMPTGGGLGRGLEQARTNLKKALEVIYQELVDSITDEFDPRGEGNMADQTMLMASQATKMEVDSIVKEFITSVTPPGQSEYSDEYMAMGRSGRFYDK